MNRLVALFSAVAFCSVHFFSLGQANPCCNDCTCLLCGEVESCANLPPSENPPAPADHCVGGGFDNCGIDLPSPCSSWTENKYSGSDEGCVPIDGGLGFLIAGGLGMGVIGTRRRQRLELLER